MKRTASRKAIASHVFPKVEIAILPAIGCQHPHLELPKNFAQISQPQFQCGDRVRWVPLDGETDWGTIVGKFYNYASHCRKWKWCYLIWLDGTSKSAAWCQSDIAWEEDLEPFAISI